MDKDDEASGLDRLATIFGREALERLVMSLRAELSDAATDEVKLQDRAHRLAGSAGTLGFGALSRELEMLSRGDGNSADAQQEVQAAIILIDGWLTRG